MGREIPVSRPVSTDSGPVPPTKKHAITRRPEARLEVAFFEGKTGAPRTAIIDTVEFRIARLKKAVETVTVDRMIAAFDGEDLHIVPDLAS